MTTTITAAEAKQAQQKKVSRKVTDLMQEYADLVSIRDSLNAKVMEESKPAREEYEQALEKVKAKYETKLSINQETLDDVKKQIVELSGEVDKKGNLVHKNMFIDGNWKFEDGTDGHYLHIKTETVEKTGPEFDLSKFIKKFGDLYVSVKYNIKELKKAFSDGDQRKQFEKYDFDLQNNETVEIKQSKAKA